MSCESIDHRIFFGINTASFCLNNICISPRNNTRHFQPILPEASLLKQSLNNTEKKFVHKSSHFIEDFLNNLPGNNTILSFDQFETFTINSVGDISIGFEQTYIARSQKIFWHNKYWWFFWWKLKM